MPFKFVLIKTLKLNKARGFTLVEMIIGIVVFSISLAIVSQFIPTTEKNSADQIHQIKAAELGQALLNDIMSRAYDENSDMAGGRWRCNETRDDGSSLPCSTNLGPDAGETSRDLFDDVDDFDGFSDKVTATNASLDGSYDTFDISVSVIYNGSVVRVNNLYAKQITITVTTPLGTDITFSAFRANY